MLIRKLMKGKLLQKDVAALIGTTPGYISHLVSKKHKKNDKDLRN